MDKRKKWQFSQLFQEFNNWLLSGFKDDKKANFMDINGKNGADFVRADTPSNDIDFDCLQATQNNCPYVEHTLSIQQLSDCYPLSRINCSAPKESGGLNGDEAENALHEQGPNVIEPKRRRKRDQIKVFFKQFLNKFRILLLITCICCLITYSLDKSREKDLTMSIILLIIFTILSCIGYIEKSKIQNQIDGRQRISLGGECSVIRGSKEVRINSKNLVRGDLVWIRRSDRVAADCRLLYATDLKIEISCISGETEWIEYTEETAQKSVGVFEANNVVFAGSHCHKGEALGLVIRTKNSTLLGQLTQMSDVEKHKSRLEIEYSSFSRTITLVTLFMATVTFIVGLILNGLDNFNTVLINGFFIVIIANIPQGLPVTLSAQLIFIARRLAKIGMFIKRADIADTLGLTSVLIVDKSAFLSPNQMRLTHLWLNRRLLTVDKNALRDDEKLANKQILDEIFDIISVCNSRTSETYFEEPVSGKKKKFRFNSSKKHYQQPAIQTKDSVLADFVQNSGRSVDERCSKFETLFELPFSLNRRFYLAVLRKRQSEDAFEEPECFAVLKGAPEELIQECTSIRVENGENEALCEELLDEFESHYTKLRAEGHVCIGFASMVLDPFEDVDFEYTYEQLLQSRKWCFLGLTAVTEPPLPNIELAVKQADQAKIRIFLITNDHPTSAEYLARQVGLYNHNLSTSVTSFSSIDSINTSSTAYATSDKSSASLSIPAIVNGENLDQMSSHEWSALLKHRHVIFAKTTSTQKLQLINQCHRLNYIVALTGGNEFIDAKSLKEADIGILTKTNGSVFAKNAADIIGSSDLPNIIKSIAMTRLLFDNFRKTLAYALSHLMPELLPVLLSFIFGFPLGLNSVQVLTIDLVTEIPPSIALIFEPAERDVMKRPSRRPNSRLVTPALLGYSYCIAGSLIGTGCLIAYFSVFWFYGFATSDLFFTANHHWTQNSSILTASLTGKDFDGMTQWHIYEQACAAWHICLVFSQIFNLLSCTTRRTSLLKHGIRNPFLVFAIIAKIIVMFSIVFIPPLQWIVGVQPPPIFVWFIPLFVGFVLLLVNEARKFFIRRTQSNLIVRMLRW